MHCIVLLPAILVTLKVQFLEAWIVVPTGPLVTRTGPRRISPLPWQQQQNPATSTSSLTVRRAFSADDNDAYYDESSVVDDDDDLSDEELAETMGEWNDEVYVTRPTYLSPVFRRIASGCRLQQHMARSQTLCVLFCTAFLLSIHFLFSARYNSVHLTGRIGSDPEPRYFDDGKVVVNLSLATRRKYHSMERSVQKIEWGEEETDWYGLEIWVRTMLCCFVFLSLLPCLY